jgi:ribonuclease T2
MRVGCAKLAACLAAALLTGSGALAQHSSYGERSEGYAGGARSQRSFEPGQFDYYLLSLSWSPTHCAGLSEEWRDPQCAPRGRPFAFVLHGLWPQFEHGWPQDCRTPDRGFVPSSVAERMRDIMPSDRLVFHEYRKHGSCSGLGVEGYFELARRLFGEVKIPRRFVSLTQERVTVAPSELMGEFLAANPRLKADMIAVSCAGPGNRLREVRICFDKRGDFRACGRNENQAKLCRAARMYVPPVRGGIGSGTPPTDADIPFPGPFDERRQ